MFVRSVCVALLTSFLFVVAKDNKHILHLASSYFEWRDVGSINALMCSVNETSKVMNHLMSYDKGRFRSVASGLPLLANPEAFLVLMSVSHYKLGVLLDYSCDFGKNILNQSSENYMLNGSYSWLIWGADKGALGALNFGLDSEVVLALPDGTLWDLYKVNYTTSLNATQAGTFSTSLGLSVFLNGSKVQRRSNFHKIKFKGSLVLTKLEVNSSHAEEIILDTGYLPHFDSGSRFAYMMFLHLGDLFNFTYQITDSWGYLLPGESRRHDGMVGFLERGEVDISLTPASLYTHRMDVVDFVHPIWRFRTCFIFRHPSTKGVYKALVMPLTPTAWVCTGVLLLVVVATLRLIHGCDFDLEDTDLSWSASAVLVVGALAQQGLSQASCRTPIRIITLFVLILSVVLYSFYNAVIVTSLLTQPPKYIKTIPQLIDTDIGMGVENTAYTRNYFLKSTDPLTNILYRKKLKTPTGFMAVPDGIERMRTKAYAFYAEDATLYVPIDKSFSNSEKCSLAEIELFPPYLVSSPVPKNSPLRDFFSCGFLLMRERGILYREDKVWHPRRPQCVDQKLVTKVNLKSVTLAFLVLLGGIVLSVVILVVERTVYRWRIKPGLEKVIQKFSKQE